ncbi:hypothetical protein SAMN06269185_0834 [Natronoarchaeum philippinense]|uniref:DUF7527 domain-containing protein n=1 Tax=Natronoarchaeum philippinense TaxID=558529 RepID=A0A285N7Q3_NATPI|nr:transcriptional regulator [Natronoarchaeum philippinense]SNZ05348.1 hypothetical protein SAMN06269185_0834 [Natronoarchaeum philippinense]
MNSRTQERVERWESRSFSGGFGGLRDLADSDFSGAVEAAGTWLFMLNGRVVGIHEGSIDDFEDASGTAHVAPDPALPLLCTMWESGGETQGKYYTEDTGVSEVDDTLTSGSFTGYLELSENVLSGDYYVVYYGGRSMSAAFVGNNEELIGGEEAFDRADDEVGIYEVRDVDVDVIDIPEPADAGADEAAAAGASLDGADSTDSDAGSPEPDAEPAGVDAADYAAASGRVDATETGTADDERTRPASASDELDQSPSAGDGIDPRADAEDARTDIDADRSHGDAEDRIAGYEDVEFGGDQDATDDIGSVDDAGNDRSPASGADETGAQPDKVEHDVDDPAVGGRSTTAETGRTETTDASAEESAPSDQNQTDHRLRTDESGSDDGLGATDAQSAAARTTEQIADDSEPKQTESASAAEPTTTPDRDATGTAGAGSVERTDNGDRAESHELTSERGAVDHDATPDSGVDPRTEQEVDWQNAQTIPSLDPDHSFSPEPDDGGATAASAAGSPTGTAGTGSNDRARRSASSTSTNGLGSNGESRSRQSSRRSQQGDRQQTATGRAAASDDSGPSKADLEEREERIDELEDAVERIREERDQLQTERDRLDQKTDSLREEIDQRDAEIERLEAEVERLETALEDAGVTAHDADVQLRPAEATAGTNLFVRYRSKGDATLEAAHAGDADADAVNGNIRLERHTQFDADAAAVNGQPYDEYLASTLSYQFVRWVVERLLYEIRDTGHAGGLSDLYDALPDIDRAELGGEVDIVYTEDGEEVTEQATFDVVLRDRMGNPLIVADLNDSRDPATESMLVELESAASRIKQANDELAAAFLVTSSFFEPGALEAVSEATSGSLLSRDSRESFVKLSRKQGYHLCLVEARADEFHINVPEL